MDSKEILAIIEKILRETLDDDAIIATETLNADDVDGWDSFSHLNLVIAIEQSFNVKFALGELQELENVGDMIALIQDKLSQ